MKLYKVADAPAGQRWRSAKTGLKVHENVEIELPKEGRQGMADFLNANELEIMPQDGPGPEPGEEPDVLVEAEQRAVRASRPPPAPIATRSWEATDVEDFILNRASIAEVENIFARLGTRFKELASAGKA